MFATDKPGLTQIVNAQESRWLVAMVLAVSVVSAGGSGSVDAAQIVDNSTVTITANYTEYSGTYVAGNALDTAVGFELTDYATFQGGSKTFIDFDFGELLTFSRVEFTDRVTSGAGQGNFSGTTGDAVTGFDLIFSTDSNFGDNADVTVSTTNIVVPTNPLTPADLTTVVPINSVIARYLRWDVTAAQNLANSGASNFAFYIIPEPASAALLALGSLAILGRRRDR